MTMLPITVDRLWRLVRQAFTFGVVGVIAGIVDFGGFAVLTKIIPFFDAYYVATNLLTAGAAITVAYYLNGRWTFRGRQGSTFLSYSRYLVVYTSGIGWQTALLAGLVELVDVPKLFAKAVAIIIVGFSWNFLLAKFWVFRSVRVTDGQ